MVWIVVFHLTGAPNPAAKPENWFMIDERVYATQEICEKKGLPPIYDGWVLHGGPHHTKLDNVSVSCEPFYMTNKVS